mgnify:CR=1 FL=1
MERDLTALSQAWVGGVNGSFTNEPTVKRCTAKRKAAVAMDIFKGKTTVAEVAR